jgi:hypothetical protein
MKTPWLWAPVLSAALLTPALPPTSWAQDAPSDVPFLAAAVEQDAADSIVAALPPLEAPLPPEPPVRFRERDLSGPQLGFTFGGGSVYRTLRDNGMGPVISQFGWHFERQIVPLGAGPQLVTEAIPLVGGVEYGKLVPSLNLALGVRLPSGLEFGLGPSFSVTGHAGLSKGLVAAVGKTIDYGGVNIPLNLAVSLNQKGTRVTVLAGYAIRRSSR